MQSGPTEGSPKKEQFVRKAASMSRFKDTGIPCMQAGLNLIFALTFILTTVYLETYKASCI